MSPNTKTMVRILSIDVAYRTLAVCVLKVEDEDNSHGPDCHCHPKWAGVTIEKWSTVDLLTMHGCKAKKIASVPCERLMHYMINYFQQLLQEIDSSTLTHILIERQHAKNKLSRYMSMCLYTFFFQYCGYRLEQKGKTLKMVADGPAPQLKIVHAKHKLTVLPHITAKDIKKTAKMTDYDVRKAMAVAKVDYLVKHWKDTEGTKNATAISFWTGITRKDRRDDPADALLMALWVIEHNKVRNHKSQ